MHNSQQNNTTGENFCSSGVVIIFTFPGKQRETPRERYEDMIISLQIGISSSNHIWEVKLGGS